MVGQGPHLYSKNPETNAKMGATKAKRAMQPTPDVAKLICQSPGLDATASHLRDQISCTPGSCDCTYCTNGTPFNTHEQHVCSSSGAEQHALHVSAGKHLFSREDAACGVYITCGDLCQRQCTKRRVWLDQSFAINEGC